MRWFRLRQRCGSYLALAVLVFQLVLAFGHVHLDHAAPHGGDAAVATLAANGPEVPNGPQAPEDHCATCALIHLAQSLLTPDAPVVPLPVALDRPPLVAAAGGLTASHPALFRARAPPIA